MAADPALPAYCTNVVAGRTLAQTRERVASVFGAVRERIAPGGVLPLGLWLSARAAAQLAETPGGARSLRDELAARGLAVRTLNAFPYHDFHGASVKRGVYSPNWADTRRLLYTTTLAELLPELLPAGARDASISTLPLGWRPEFALAGGGASLGLASSMLAQLVQHLARVEERTGVRVHVDLEPEPGCTLDRAEDAAAFLTHALPRRAGTPDPRRYIGICHDVCHSAVMFEEQSHALRIYRDAGVRVGKVQVSSAPVADGSPESIAVLAAFAEPRYLHQTSVRGADSRFFEDLPDALAQHPAGEWRTHFHVPVFAPRLGALGTTRGAIEECIAEIARWPAAERPAFEVETYAWDVLPEGVEAGEAVATPGASGDARLAAGIAQELRWVRERLAAAHIAAFPEAA